MTISLKRLKEEQDRAYRLGVGRGQEIGRAEAKAETLATRQKALIDLTNAAAMLAKANASLTYSLSRITDKLL